MVFQWEMEFSLEFIKVPETTRNMYLDSLSPSGSSWKGQKHSSDLNLTAFEILLTWKHHLALHTNPLCLLNSNRVNFREGISTSKELGIRRGLKSSLKHRGF